MWWFLELVTLQNLDGRTFLAVYGGLILISTLAFVALNRLVRNRRLSGPTDLPAFELAMVEGGDARALQTAVLELLHAECLQREQSSIWFKLKATGRKPPNDETLHQLILERAAQTQSLYKISTHKPIQKILRQSRRRLVKDGWLAYPWLLELTSLVTLLWMVCLLGMGLARMYLGVFQGRPVTYLVYELLFGFFILLFGVKQNNPTTLAAAQYLKDYRRRSAALATQIRSKAANVSAADQVLALALFGLAPALEGLVYVESPVLSMLESASNRASSAVARGGGGSYESSSSDSFSSASCGSSSASSCGGGGGGSTSSGCGG